MEGEIKVQAATNGRRITLDPIMERDPLTVEVRRVENSLPAGLRQPWISGTGDDHGGGSVHFDLSCGAGVGSPYMILAVQPKGGERIEEVIDMRDVLNDWVKAAIAAGPDPKVGG